MTASYVLTEKEKNGVVAQAPARLQSARSTVSSRPRVLGGQRPAAEGRSLLPEPLHLAGPTVPQLP